MKKFLRKVNRGLVLGGVLIIGTTIYIIADLKNFEKEKPVVEQTITEYAQAVAKFNITPEKNREYNITLNKEDSQKLTADWQAIIDEYWIDKKASAKGNIIHETDIVQSDARDRRGRRSLHRIL
jgi:hypothetical protein